jgi:hypothetical protein
VIYRNSPLVQQVSWSSDDTPFASDIALHFLRSERDLLRLANVAPIAVADLHTFLTATAGCRLIIERSSTGEIVVHDEESRESLLITGKTAEVLRSYIDCQPVFTADRLDMTLRRQLSFSA